MQAIIRRLCAATLLLACGLPAQAHHSFSAEYDSDRPVALSGKVIRVEWEYPHVWIYVNVRTATGETSTWGFWEDSPAILQRKGISRDVLKPGDLIRAYGFQARDGSRRASAGKVLFEDGSRVFAPTRQEPARSDS